MRLGAGKIGLNYARIVHENPNAYHKPPGQYKYLETPLKAKWPELKRRLDAIKPKAVEK
jgi:hypothetical protein